ncbi:MAG: ATP-binding cassette domain-containing protein [Ignavibacteriaceae bacterium]
MSSKNLLSVKELKKYYTSDTGFNLLVLDNINFSFESDEERGKIKTVLAPLGAGKSTLLKIIAAVEKASQGSVILNGKEYNIPAGEIVYIPEKPSSFPWYNVRENIEFPLKTSSNNSESSVNNLISLVGLAGYEDHFPHNKSYGFRFRISLARALSVNPKIVLIDDSFKNMDPETRDEIYQLIKVISSELKINFLLGTTNIHEAIFLSDEILLMKKNPGTVFKEINIKEKIQLKDFTATKDVIALRDEIESYFRAENIGETVNFSI